jgi:hypothetical protein
MKQKRAVMAAAFWVALWATASPAWTQPSEPAPAPAQESSTEASIHGYGDRDKSCLAWTDQCRSCARAADNAVNCSNIGIACQPAEITCTSRQAEPAK